MPFIFRPKESRERPEQYLEAKEAAKAQYYLAHPEEVAEEIGGTGETSRMQWQHARDLEATRRLRQAAAHAAGAHGLYRGRTKQQIDEEIAKLAKELGHAKRPGDIALEVNRGLPPIYVSMAELEAIATNHDLAAQIYSRATGIESPMSRDVDHFMQMAARTEQHYLHPSEPASRALHHAERSVARLAPIASMGRPELLAELAQRGVAPRHYTEIGESGLRSMLARRRPAETAVRRMPAEVNIPELLKRSSYPHQAVKAQTREDLIAPFNVHHREAEEMQRRSAGQTEEHAAEMRSNLGHLRESSILPKVERELADARRQDTAAQMVPYDDLIRQMRADADERWRDEISPAMSGQFAIMGATRSGAHARALQRAHGKYNQQLEREVAKLRVHAMESARDAAERQQTQALQRAQAIGHAGEAQQAHGARTEQLAAQHGHQHKMHQAADIAAMGQLAQQQQQQAQNEANERRRLHNEARDLPMDVMISEMAANRGIPYARAPQAPGIPYPTPPNAMSTLGGLVGSAAGMFAQPRQFSTGGKVKRQRFADGGFAGNGFAADPYASQQQGIAQQLQNYQFNPWANAASNVGAHMLAADPGKAMQAMGKGLQQANLDREQAYNNKLTAAEKAANLYGAMNQSLRLQREFLATHGLAKERFNETKRHNRIAEELATAKHAPSAQHHEVTIGGKTFLSQQKLGLSPQDHAQAKKHDETLAKLDAKQAPYDGMLTFLETNKPDTGLLAEYTPNVRDKARGYERHLSSMVASVIPSGVMTKAKLDFAKSQKPTQMDSVDEVKDFAVKGKQVIEEEKEPLLLAQEYRTYGIPDRVTIGAYKEWEKHGKQGEFEDYLQAVLAGEALPEGHHKQEHARKIMAPDGTIREIPEKDVEAALQHGGQLVE